MPFVFAGLVAGCETNYVYKGPYIISAVCANRGSSTHVAGSCTKSDANAKTVSDLEAQGWEPYRVDQSGVLQSVYLRHSQ